MLIFFSKCAKMLVSLHETAPGHKLQTVYKKYSQAEKYAVALCSPALSLNSISFNGWWVWIFVIADDTKNNLVKYVYYFCWWMFIIHQCIIIFQINSFVCMVEENSCRLIGSLLDELEKIIIMLINSFKGYKYNSLEMETRNVNFKC